jgi:two-component system cell cycle response regulator DivK
MAAHTILIVDDYADALDVWDLYFKAAGFTVLTAGDGLTAVQQALAALPDIIVLDLELPGLSGFEVAETIRAQPSTSAIPLIAATGYSQARQHDQARAVGFDSVVVKPCEPQVLLAEVRRLLADKPASPSSPNRQPDSTSG